MTSPILGLHHVTATVDDAQADLDFCAGVLGLRLVKRTVNFDNHHVYHFYYGDERGTPGTIWTTFPYKGRGVRTGVRGAGQITTTSFSVPPGSLSFWRRRLADAGVPTHDRETPFGEPSLACTDPSGLGFALVEGPDDRAPWAAGIDTAAAIRGLHSVTMTVAHRQPSIDFLRHVLGFATVNEGAEVTRMAANGDVAGRRIDVIHAPAAQRAMNGLGTVHHVAMAVESDADQLHMRRELIRLGVPVTEVMDRQYFRSIYFREPGGVLFEIATMGPGFTDDEPLALLGHALKLPPWEEPARADIESGLAPVTVPTPQAHATS